MTSTTVFKPNPNQFTCKWCPYGPDRQGGTAKEDSIDCQQTISNGCSVLRGESNMDDYKREIYMRVLRNLQTRQTNTVHICINLEVILDEDRYLPDSRNAILNELFPEFAALFDGTMWLKDGACWYEQIDKSNGWWQSGWYEPRIRALECILRDSA